jgi:ribosomal protein L19
MAKLIKQAENKAVNYKIGDKVVFYSWWHDGRTSGSDEYNGIIIKINKVTIDVQVGNGDIWRVERHELHRL